MSDEILNKPFSEVSREQISDLMKDRRYCGVASERDPRVVNYISGWFREKYPGPGATHYIGPNTPNTQEDEKKRMTK